MIMHRIMDPMCRAVVRRLDEYLDGELPLSARMLIWMHLKMCSRCGPRHKFEKAILDDVKAKSNALRISPEASDRLCQVLRAHQDPGNA